MGLEQTLKDFGLDEKESQIYLGLCKYGSSTVLTLSRRLPIKRTTIYRLLEQLKAKGLVETQVDDKTTYYTAGSPLQFESLVVEQEKTSKDLRAALSSLTTMINIVANRNKNETSVRFFRGVQGLKQMEWRMCDKAQNGDLLIFDSDQWENILGQEFAETIREEMVRQNIIIYDLLPPTGRIKQITNNGVVTWTKNMEYILHHFRHRKVLKDMITLTQDIYMFHNTVHFHGYSNEDIIGIEIENSDLAGMLTQMFWHYWGHAQVVDRFGAKIKRSRAPGDPGNKPK